MNAIIGEREGLPAINVKDDALYAREPALALAYALLPEDELQAIYEDVQRDFWEVWAPAIAESFKGFEIGRAGRSGGWLTVDGVAASSTRFQRFAEDITAEVEYAQAQYRERIMEAATYERRTIHNNALAMACWRD